MSRLGPMVRTFSVVAFALFHGNPFVVISLISILSEVLIELVALNSLSTVLLEFKMFDVVTVVIAIVVIFVLVSLEIAVLEADSFIGAVVVLIDVKILPVVSSFDFLNKCYLAIFFKVSSILSSFYLLIM